MGTARIADLLRRLAATAYDLLVLAGILVLTSLALIIARGGLAVPVGNPVFQAFLAVQAAGYFIGFWSRGGQTPGMQAWHLRVEMAGGAPLSMTTAAWRLAGALLSATCLGLGLLWLLFDRDGRAWHDRLSNTKVVLLARAGR